MGGYKFWTLSNNSSIQPEDDVSSQCTSINEELKEVGRCPQSDKKVSRNRTRQLSSDRSSNGDSSDFVESSSQSQNDQTTDNKSQFAGSSSKT